MSACLLWTGRIDRGGYGRCRHGDQKNGYAHRKAWEDANGPIPLGAHVLHSCDTPACINPQHLRLGTHADNMADKVARGRQSRQGAPAGELSPQHKLTEHQVFEIRSSSESGAALARRFHVTQQTICDVRAGRSWKHLLTTQAA